MSALLFHVDSRQLHGLPAERQRAFWRQAAARRRAGWDLVKIKDLPGGHWLGEWKRTA